jgi:phospholipid/cholesterol/gamma-HCH transport system substrate-binding protein
METKPPTVTRILIAIGFALSCFGLALFLWIAFGGPLPLKPEGYRVTVPFAQATPQLAVESDVRISGVSVGKVKSIELADNNDTADAVIEIDSQYAPIPEDTKAILRAKTLLGETYVELTPGSNQAPTVPEGGSLPPAQVAESVQLDEIFRTFNRPTRDAFRGWMESQAAALRGRGQQFGEALSELEPFSESANRALRILDTQQHAVRELVHSGGTVFQALSERQGQLRGLIQNSDTVFSTTAQRNEDLAEAFRILPTFQRETRLTLDRLNEFAIDADPLVQQLRPAAQQLSPTLEAAGRAAPDLQRFFVGLRGTIAASHEGFPALRRLLDDDLTPLLARLGGNVDGRTPWLAEFNPIIKVAKKYRHEITAFLGNITAATNHAEPAAERNFAPVKVLRTTSPLNPQTLAAFPQRLNSERANPYFKPGGYNKLKQGLESFQNTPCSDGINATLDPSAADDPTFYNRYFNGRGSKKKKQYLGHALFLRIKKYAMSEALSTSEVPAPPCDKQSDFKSIGTVRERTPYLHVRREP